jgi:hypothetical protein
MTYEAVCRASCIARILPCLALVSAASASTCRAAALLGIQRDDRVALSQDGLHVTHHPCQSHRVPLEPPDIVGVEGHLGQVLVLAYSGCPGVIWKSLADATNLTFLGVPPDVVNRHGGLVTAGPSNT